MSVTVIEHVLARLKALGIFGVAGDCAFPKDDAIVKFPGVEWVGCCNELNAAHAADGRIRGVGTVNTTYGLGQLRAIGAIAGACAEHVPVLTPVITLTIREL